MNIGCNEVRFFLGGSGAATLALPSDQGGAHLFYSCGLWENQCFLEIQPRKILPSPLFYA
jgi:hypothetical protein